MKFGLRFTDKTVELIYMETGAILLEGAWAIGAWLSAYDDEYTLVLVD